MNKLNYGIIGKNWGSKIFRILKKLNKNVIYLDIKSPKNYKNIYSYKINVKREILEKSPNIDILWIATPTNFKYFLVEEALNNNLNVIVEKPWLHDEKKTKKIIQITKKKKLQVGVHFEFLYLKQFLNLKNKQLINNKNNLFSGFFNVKKKSHFKKLSAFHELGSHIVAIKLKYFNNTKFKTFKSNYNKKNLRKIIIDSKIKSFSYDFTNNSEKLIQKYIKDFETKLLYKNNYKIDLKFASNVYKCTKYLIKKYG